MDVGGFRGIGPARFEDDPDDVFAVGQVRERVVEGAVVVEERRGWEDLAADGAWVDVGVRNGRRFESRI